jgi:HSP20 family protein
MFGLSARAAERRLFHRSGLPQQEGVSAMSEMTTSAKETRPAPATRPARTDWVSPMGWLRSEIDRLFEDFGQPGASAFSFGVPAAAPALEMVDEDKAYRLTAELPGLAEKDVELSVADGVITISGEKKEEKNEKDNGYMLSERRYGSFRRQLALPSDVNPDGIKAGFKDGVLTVTLPKDENAKPRERKIAIE